MTIACAESTVDLILAEEIHLRGFARRLARCDSDADDLVQETMLRAYHARDRFRPGTSVRAWTTTILRRLFLTGAIRAKRRWLRTDTDLGGPLDVAVDRRASAADGPASNIDVLGERLDDEIKWALGRVPAVHREAFLLAAVQDLSCEEIGRRLGVPAGTVMSRLFRARKRLRGELALRRREFPATRRGTAAASRTRSGFAPTSSAVRA